MIPGMHKARCMRAPLCGALCRAEFYRLRQTDIYVKETTSTSFPRGRLHAVCAWVAAPISERDGTPRLLSTAVTAAESSLRELSPQITEVLDTFRSIGLREGFTLLLVKSDA